MTKTTLSLLSDIKRQNTDKTPVSAMNNKKNESHYHAWKIFVCSHIFILKSK